MILVTTNTITGKKFEGLGIAKGSTIQTRHMGKDIAAGFKTLAGGEITSYNEIMNDARALATKRMVNEVKEMGADVIVCVRYSSAEIMQGAAEVIAYGTAVKYI